MTYQYDFGDDWRHEVVLKKIIPLGDVVKTPICYGGQRQCPPEGEGGLSGYKLVEKVLPENNCDDYFDLRAVNETLSRMRNRAFWRGTPFEISTVIFPNQDRRSAPLSCSVFRVEIAVPQSFRG
jgi:hypothetical protein